MRKSKKLSAIELAFMNSEEKYRIVADFTYDWETWTSPEGRFLYVSPSCERISGYPPAAFMENPSLFEEIIHPDERQTVSKHMRSLEKLNKVIELDFRIIRADGAVRWLNHISQPVFSMNGEPLGRRGSNRDVTERKKTEEELHISQARLHAQNLALEQKNIALRELLGQIELEKNELKNNILSNMDRLVIPLIDEVACLCEKDPHLLELLELLKQNIRKLADPFSSRLSSPEFKLSRKELRICDMIRNGFTNKQIASFLGLSLRTVETHRNRIRKKLALTGTKVNLPTFLDRLNR